MPELAGLASSGIVFDAHRATTGLANGSVASMLKRTLVGCPIIMTSPIDCQVSFCPSSLPSYSLIAATSFGSRARK